MTCDYTSKFTGTNQHWEDCG